MQGQHVQRTFGGIINPLITSDLDQFAWQPHPAGQSEATPSPGGASLARHFPIAAHGRVLAGQQLGAWLDDYYHRIHVTPAEIDLGFVVNNQSHPITVWNAYLTPMAVQEARIDDGEGLELEQPDRPPTLAALEERVYTVVVRTDGPPIIDAALIFEFSLTAARVPITGRRLLAWPYQPNWARPVVERLAYRTDVIQTHDGSEQRHRLRQWPRLGFRAQYVRHGLESRRLQALLWAWQSRNFALPLWHQVQRLEQPVAEGALGIPVNTVDLDYSADGLVILITSDREFELLTAAEVQPDGLTLARPTQQAWPVGTYVLPARPARMSQTTPLRRHTGTVLSLEADWEVGDYEPVPALADEPWYQDSPVLLRAPNRATPVDDAYERLLDVLDLGGVVVSDDPVGRPQLVTPLSYVLRNRAEIAWMRRWLQARGGRYGAFWLPTFEPDLTPTETITAASQVLSIRDIGYGLYYAQAPGRRDLLIELHDGRQFMRRIVDTLEADPGTERLLLDRALGADAPVQEVRRISFMSLCRLDADSVEFSHRSAGVAQISFVARSIG